MTVDEIEQVRAVSRAGASGPWGQWWGEMAKKTVLRRLSKRLPMSTDADELLRREVEEDEAQAPALPGSVTDLNARLRAPVAPTWPQKQGDDWIDSDGQLFDGERHGWNNDEQRPSVTAEGRFRARRGARQARVVEPTETPVGETIEAGSED
jgi:recombination protein RecT